MEITSRALTGLDQVLGQEKPDWSVRFPDIFTRNPFRGWLFDKDDFDTKQFLHPFHGTLAFTAARSSGIDFWTSILYPFGMSLLWELILETQNPSPNDQITTTVGGTFLGEGLYRLASLVLYGGGPKPAWWRYLAAFPLSPVTVFNRLVFGGRYASDLFNTGWLILAGSSAIMVLPYTVRRLPFAARNASSALYNIPDSFEVGSISLGVPPLKTFFKAVLPAMRASVISAAILMWVTSISELSASIVVYTGGLGTMPIAIFRQVDGGRLGLASAYGAALVTVILVPIVCLAEVVCASASDVPVASAGT